jgi:DNA-binding winged helix-turn-helix (wHTH) protein
MQITLKVGGNDLLRELTSAADSSAFPRLFRQEPVSWKVVPVTMELMPSDLLCFPDEPGVTLIDADDAMLMTRIASKERGMLTYMEEHSDLPLVPSPIIAVCRASGVLADIRDFPDFICDWASSQAINDLAQRIFFSLRKRNVLKTRLQSGALTLIPESRSIAFGERAARLTPTEYTLAELFLMRMGTVISFKDFVQLFKETGKSTEPNNIRVAVFQLRLKLEILTKSQVMLQSVYKKGYCLSQRAPRPATVMPSAMAA